MKTGTSCPSSTELQQLLDGSLSSDQQEVYTRHMDSCQCCQAKLEQIATEGTNLSQVVEHLDREQPLATSAYWPAVQALDTHKHTTLVQQATPSGAPSTVTRSREVSLSFLLPAEDSVYLGRLAHFDVMRILGRGGMGVVLEAFDSRLQRHVAIKVLDPDIADDEIARQRFCREARSAASITHENVVAVHQVERAGEQGLPYLVMQLISGESLEQRLSREERLSFRDVVRIGMQAAQGLAAAHEQGLIHRDIKPGNILLESSQDRVKLTDFGLARVAEDVKLTSTGYVSGTPLYMSPEQAMGEEVDARSDLFSLGAVLYEMCAGQPPFPGNSALAILRQISDSKPRPLRELNPVVPDWFAYTVDKLLAKKPEDRIQSATQLAELFEFHWAIMKASSEEIPQVCAIEEAREARRNRIIAVALATSFLAIGLLGGWMLSNRGVPAAAPAMVSSGEALAVLSANAGTVWSVGFDPTSSTVAMAVEDGAVRLWDIPSRSIKSTISAHRGIVWNSRFSHDGKLVTSGDDGLIKLWDPSKDEPLKTFKHPNAVRGLDLGHDEKLIVAGDRAGGIREWTLDADTPLVEAEQPGAVYVVALSPDGEMLATAGTDKVVRLWNAKTLTLKLPLEGHTGPVNGLAFNHDGHRVASVSWDKTIRIWDTGSGQLIKSWEGHEGDIWGVAYSPDGKKIATAGHDSAVKVWDAETGELLATYLGHKFAVHTVAFNEDGTLLASGGRDGSVRIWKIE
ncbi:MAG: serine/threonine protein kinase [Pirellulales bacterium]|nr:serine/threonine protein kinase [Pirellulales bacterium]